MCNHTACLSTCLQNTGTSLLETFTAEQIVLHLDQIRTLVAAQRAAQPPPLNPSDVCSVCQLLKLSFEPPVVYCTTCGTKIKRGQTYYCTPMDTSNDLKGSWCHQCYSDSKTDKIYMEMKKTDLTKRKNDEEIEEAWVQCNNCEAWVHQICGMFNKGRNNNDVHYICPECLLTGLETNQRSKIEVCVLPSQNMVSALPAERLHQVIIIIVGRKVASNNNNSRLKGSTK